MDVVLEYTKVPVTIQSYAKDQSYDKATGNPSEPKDTRHARRRADVTATDSPTSEKITGLNTNDDRTFTLDGKFYLLKEFMPEDICLGKSLKSFGDARREKKMD